MENIIQQIQTTMNSAYIIYIYFVHKIYILSFYHIYVCWASTQVKVTRYGIFVIPFLPKDVSLCCVLLRMPVITGKNLT